jgi:3-oxoacyl-[acyl-carrier protein] reductase
VELEVAGRVAVVTGASRGLGRAAARALGAEGVDLVIAARGADALGVLAAELEANGTSVFPVAIDVTESEAPELLVAAATERFGRIDIVVANSGGPPLARALDVDDEGVHAAVDANLLTTVRFARAALPGMRTAGWGRICAIASSAVIQPIPELALSNMARSGLRAWARTAAGDLAGSGVTVNLVCPGVHATDRMIELGVIEGPIGDPGDFGRIVAFVCSEPAGFINGTTILVDGGATLAL